VSVIKRMKNTANPVFSSSEMDDFSKIELEANSSAHNIDQLKDIKKWN
jgi:hypothetical protein